jgi:hypothetical protein
MMSGALTITEDTLGPALRQWGAMRARSGKDLKSTLYKAAKLLLDFAWSKIPEGNKALIESNLMRMISTYSRVGGRTRGRLRGSKAADKYRGTVAAAIVATINYKGAKLKAGFADDKGFYAAVAQFVSGRKFSAGLHRAGLLAGYDLINGRPRGRSPKYRHAPGSASQRILEESAEIVFENFASSKGGGGMMKVAPDSFERAAIEVARMIDGWMAKDALAEAKRAGFEVTGG